MVRLLQLLLDSKPCSVGHTPAAISHFFSSIPPSPQARNAEIVEGPSQQLPTATIKDSPSQASFLFHTTAIHQSIDPVPVNPPQTCQTFHLSPSSNRLTKVRPISNSNSNSNLSSSICNLQSPVFNLHSSVSNLQPPIFNLQSPFLTLQSSTSNLWLNGPSFR